MDKISRTRASRAARRENIQRAADRLLRLHPACKVTVEQIAREASVSVGAVYLSFSTKDDLIVSLLELQGDELDQVGHEAIDRLIARGHDEIEGSTMGSARAAVERLGEDALCEEFRSRLREAVA